MHSAKSGKRFFAGRISERSQLQDLVMAAASGYPLLNPSKPRQLASQ